MLISSSSQIHISRRQKSSLLTSNELLFMLTKTNSQPKQKIAIVMTCKVYTHWHTHVYTLLFRITIRTQRLFQYERLKWSNITAWDKSWLF